MSPTGRLAAFFSAHGGSPDPAGGAATDQDYHVRQNIAARPALLAGGYSVAADYSGRRAGAGRLSPNCKGGFFRENDGRYGYRRIHAALRSEGVAVSEKVVCRIMKEEHLAAKLADGENPSATVIVAATADGSGG